MQVKRLVRWCAALGALWALAGVAEAAPPEASAPASVSTWVGYGVGGGIAYVTGGSVRAREDRGDAVVQYYRADSDAMSGWTAGIGYARILTPRLTLRMELDHNEIRTARDLLDARALDPSMPFTRDSNELRFSVVRRF